VPSEFVKKWILEKFNSNVLKFIIVALPEIRKIEYVVEKIDPSMIKKTLPPKKTKSAAPLRGSPMEENTPLSLNLSVKNNKTNLNPKYRFDNFVVGSFNEVAFAASQAIVKKEEVVYNPLLIYGNTGYGKTHLIQAVGNNLKIRDPSKKVFYTTSEKFYMDVIDFIGLKSNKTNNFKKKYREYDVFIMDDIQFLTKKERTQEELFHLFNFLYDNDKQIILSSDQHPNQISDLEDRLKSRFNAGMIIDIQSPDYESRLEILKKKTKINNYEIPDDVLEYVATTVTGNIRELEGILNNIFIQTEIKKHPLQLIEVKDIIKSNYKKKQPIDYKKLVELVSNYYNIDKENIYKKTRKKEFVGPRQIIMYLLREDFTHSYPSIGEKLGGRDHTTVMHSYEKVKRGLLEKTELKKDIEVIRSMY
jgi:chromosomal replication initiator protein